MTSERNAYLLLRFGVAFAFLYPAIDAFVDPYSWIGYFPSFLHGIVPDLVLLHAFGALEILIGLWILSGKKILLPSVTAAGLLGLIVFFNLRDFQIVFRDVAIMATALALPLVARAMNSAQNQGKRS